MIRIDGAGPVGGQLTVWQVYAIAGGMTIAGLLLGQSWRWSLPARLLLLGAAAVLALGLFTTFGISGRRRS